MPDGGQSTAPEEHNPEVAIRVARIIEALCPDDVTHLIDTPGALPAWARKAWRDDIVRAGRAHFSARSQTAVAEAMAAEIAKYLASPLWEGDRQLVALGADASVRRRALHSMLKANGGESLGYRRLLYIFNEPSHPAIVQEGGWNLHGSIADCRGGGTDDPDDRNSLDAFAAQAQRRRRPC